MCVCVENTWECIWMIKNRNAIGMCMVEIDFAAYFAGADFIWNQIPHYKHIQTTETKQAMRTVWAVGVKRVRSRGYCCVCMWMWMWMCMCQRCPFAQSRYIPKYVHVLLAKAFSCLFDYQFSQDKSVRHTTEPPSPFHWSRKPKRDFHFGSLFYFVFQVKQDIPTRIIILISFEFAFVCSAHVCVCVCFFRSSSSSSVSLCSLRLSFSITLASPVFSLCASIILCLNNFRFEFQ